MVGNEKKGLVINAGEGSGLEEEEAFCLSALHLPQSPFSSSLQPVSSPTRNGKVYPFTLSSSPSSTHHPLLYSFFHCSSPVPSTHLSIHPSAPSDRALLTAVLLESLRPALARLRPRPAGNRAEGRGTSKTQWLRSRTPSRMGVA